MNLDRPVAPDPYDLLPRVGSSVSRVTMSVTGPRWLPLTRSPARTFHRNCRGAARPRRPRVTPSLVSIPTRRRPPASGTGSWSTCRPDVLSLPGGAGKEDGSGLPHGALHCRNDYGTMGYGGARARRKVIGPTAITSLSMRWTSRSSVSPRTPRRPRCRFNLVGHTPRPRDPDADVQVVNGDRRQSQPARVPNGARVSAVA